MLDFIDDILLPFAVAVDRLHPWQRPLGASERIRIPVEGYAPAELAQNSERRSNHWAKRYRYAEEWKDKAKKAAKSWVGVAPMFTGPVFVTVYSFIGFGRVRMDLLNEPACFKPYLDGFTLAGIWSDDSVVESFEAMHIRLSTKEGRRLLPMDGVTVFAIEGSKDLVTPIGHMKDMAMREIDS